MRRFAGTLLEVNTQDRLQTNRLASKPLFIVMQITSVRFILLEVIAVHRDAIDCTYCELVTAQLEQAMEMDLVKVVRQLQES